MGRDPILVEFEAEPRSLGRRDDAAGVGLDIARQAEALGLLRVEVFEVVAVADRQQHVEIGGAEQRIARHADLAVQAKALGRGAELSEPGDAQLERRAAQNARGLAADVLRRIEQLEGRLVANRERGPQAAAQLSKPIDFMMGQRVLAPVEILASSAPPTLSAVAKS